ncbi:MAG: carbon-nitrogen hydrolase family protein [Myxococcales bacterium]|nr:carbon-nitrogen hydrolase family protein [Myxococcales bacterium]
MQRVKVAVVQLRSTEDVTDNLRQADIQIRGAAADGARLIAVPENTGFLKTGNGVDAGEPLETSAVVTHMRALASELDVALLLGSFHKASAEPTRAYNTSVVIDRTGQIVTTYDKIHLFDIDVPGQVTFKESDDIIPGTQPVIADIEGMRLGLSICYDLRFPELYRKLAEAGAEVITVPAAFTAQTGKAHWEVLLRARAIENQCYVLAPDQWGIHGGKRHSHGDSMIIDPWGQVIARVSDGVGFACAWLDPDRLDSVRRNLPCADHRRL